MFAGRSSTEAVSPFLRATPHTPWALSLALSALLVLSSVVGLVFGRRGLYMDDAATAPAFLGQDAISLLLGLPLLLGSMRAARKGSVGGLLVWAGSLFYFAYSYAFYLLDPRVTVLFPLYAAIVSAATYGLLALLVLLDVEAVHARYATRAPRRLAGGYLAFMGAAFLALWGILLVARLAAGQQPTMVEHLVWSLDLTFALPAMLGAGWMVWRRKAWGTVLAGIMLFKATFIGFTLVVTTAVAAVGWEVAVDLAQTSMFAVMSLAGLAVFTKFLRAAR